MIFIYLFYFILFFKYRAYERDGTRNPGGHRIDDLVSIAAHSMNRNRLAYQERERICQDTS